MSDNPVPVITIDGPSGVGKGTVSLMLARTLGWHFLDSGLLYRLVGRAARRHGIPFEDVHSLTRLAAGLDVRFIGTEAQEPTILLEGDDVTGAIRTEEAGNDASRVAAIMEVRFALLQRQRDFRQRPGLVSDGRDMGTTVFPDAPLKIFLTAGAEVRAQRRYKQLKQKGMSVNLRDLLSEIEERDQRDRTRSVSPLRPAEDAVIIDTSELSVDDVYQRVWELAKRWA